MKHAHHNSQGIRIAYIGPASGTSLHRARALERLGHNVSVIDPWRWLGQSKWISRWVYYAGGLGIGLLINRPLFTAIKAVKPDLIYINQGEFLGAALLRKLKVLNAPIINYMNDNPFSDRDNQRFRSYKMAIPYYHLLAVVREENVFAAKQLGAKKVIRVWMTADEEVHLRAKAPEELKEKLKSEVVFVGTWMPERGPFMAELIQQGVPLSIWGDRWEKAPEWPNIIPHWRGPSIYDDDYAAVIQSAKICLGLLSKGNRDLHTTRSMEIPALGGLLCAERTTEHLAIYEEGKEAVFWSSVTECAAVCKKLLSDESRMNNIAFEGRNRAIRNRFFNENILSNIIEKAFE